MAATTSRTSPTTVVVATTTGPQGPAGTGFRYIAVDGIDNQSIVGVDYQTIKLNQLVLTTGSNDFTVNNDGEVTVRKGGKYVVDYSLLGEQAFGSNHEVGIETHVTRNGDAIAGTQGFYFIPKADVGFSISGSILVELNENDKLKLMILKDEDSASVQVFRNATSLNIYSLSATGPTGPRGPSDLPQSLHTTNYSLLPGDNGKHISISDGGITVPADAFNAGNVIRIYNNSINTQDVTPATGVKLYKSGESTDGNSALTMTARGLFTLLCVANNEFVLEGPFGSS